MKLPGITYAGTPLARTVNPRAVLAAGSAQGQALAQWGKTADVWGKALDTEETYKVLNEEKAKLSTMEAEIKNTPHWDVTDLDAREIQYREEDIEIQPVYDPMGQQVGERRVVRTETVAEGLYNSVASEAAAKAQSTGYYRENSATIQNQLGTAIQSGSTSVSTWAFDQRYKRLNASATANYDRAIESGDLPGALEVIDKGAKGGWLSTEEVAVMTSEAPGKAAKAISDAAINSTNDPDQLEYLAQDIENGQGYYNMLPEADRRVQAKNARNKSRGRWDDSDKALRRSQQQADADAYMAVMKGDMTVGEAMEHLRANGTPSGMDSIVGYYNMQNSYGPTFSDPNTLSAMNSMIDKLNMSNDMSADIFEIERQISVYMSGGKESPLSYKDAAELRDRARAMKDSFFSDEAYKATRDQMSMDILKRPMSSFAIFGEEVDAFAMTVYSDATRTLNNYMRQPGYRNSADWWEQNRERYEPNRWATDKLKQKGVEVQSKNGEIDWAATEDFYTNSGDVGKLTEIIKMRNKILPRGEIPLELPTEYP